MLHTHREIETTIRTAALFFLFAALKLCSGCNCVLSLSRCKNVNVFKKKSVLLVVIADAFHVCKHTHGKIKCEPTVSLRGFLCSVKFANP